MKKTTLFSLLAFFLLLNYVSGQCTDGSKYPFNNYVPLNNGAFEIINTDCRPGEYAVITNTSTTRVYTFASSVATDYITITNINDEVLTHGPSGLTWIRPSTTGSNILYYIHSNSQCGTEQTNRVRYIASQPLPSCETPTALNVSNITSNSCKISWTPPTTAPSSGYEYYFNTTNLSPTPTTTASGSTTTNAIEPLSGLNPATTYYYWVRSNCGATKGIWTYGGGFTTIAQIGCNGAIYGLFPSATFSPACNGSVEQIANNSRAGEYSNVTAQADKQYTFSSSVSTDFITITNSDGTIVYASGNTPLTWSSSAVTGVIRYYLHSNAACGNQNTSRTKSIVCATSVCGTPSNLAVSNITATSCKLTWSTPPVLPSSGYELYLNTTGTTPTAATIATQTAASNIINPLNSLVSATTYHYWVRSVCGTNKSAWVAGGSFTTNPLSGCNGSYWGLNPEATFTPANTGTSETISTNSRPGEYANVNIIANRHYTFSSSVATDYVTITNEDGSILYATAAAPLYWSSNTVSGVVRYYLHSNSECSSNDIARTRSITSAAVSPCAWPIGITVSSITANSALVTWTPSGSLAGNHEIFVSSSAYIAPATGATTTGGTRPNGVIINQLQSNTVYYLYARKFCTGGGITPWVSAGTFSTLPLLNQSCNGAFYGVFPMETFTPQHTGNNELITTDSAGGQFSYVVLSPDKQYTFSSSIGTDYITITSESGNTLLGKGSSPFTWNSGAFSGIARYYIHTQVACGSSSSTRNKYIKGITSCDAPLTTSVSNINATSAYISWTANASSYQYYFAPSNTAPADNYSTTNNITTIRNTTLSNLSTSTTYYFWVRSVCNGVNSQWVAGGSFTTLAEGCVNGSLYPNNTFTPLCNGGRETITIQAYAGEYSIINISSSTNYVFESSVATDYITITNSAGTAVYASGVSPLNWSSANLTGQIRYYMHANSNCGIQSVDRDRYITCISPNTCGLPSGITVSNITSDSAQYNYNPPANAPTLGYQLFATLTNVAPANTVPAVAGTINNFGTISGLFPNTTYYSWVRSVCITGAGLWVPGPTFTTITLTTGCNGATYGLWPADTFSPSCTGTTEVITNSALAGQYSNINIQANKAYTFTSSISTDYFTITNETGTVTYAAGTSPLNWSSNQTSGIARYYLHTNSSCGTQNTNRVKSIQCTTPISCGLPTNLAVSNITSNSVRLFWNAPTPAANSYDIYLVTTNTAPITTTNATQTSIPNLVAVLAGLSSSTTYYFWVRSNCNGTKSDWVSGGSFTTIPSLNCNGATFGLYPNATFTPTCSGSNEQIIADAWAGEYSNVNIVANKQYTFTSSIATDYITITNATGTVVFASGVTPLVWNSNTTSGVIRYHFNTNVNCGTQNTARIRSIKCETPVTCNPPTQFGSDAITATTANIGWLPSTSAPNGGYLYVYNTTQTVGGIDGSTFSTNASLTNLLPNTTYYWWVASNCVTSQSDWAYGGSFTTLGASTGCWQSISAGYTHSLGIKTEGTLWSWGDNSYGQLGDGTTTSKNSPIQIGLANNWESISTGGSISAAIKTDGTLWTWGNNTFGQLGDGTTTNRTTPTQIGTATNWKSVSVGESFIVAIKDNGTLWAWGNNNYGQLGDGTTINRSTPTQIGTATNWQNVATGAGFSVATRTNGTLWAWGYNNSGQLGDNTTTNRLLPIQIGTENDWANVAAGYAHSVGLKTNGLLLTWGNNSKGQLGDSTNTNKLTPTGVFDQVESIEAGWYYTLGTTTFGNIWACGDNVFGQLGDGTTNDRNWISVSNASDFQLISAGSYHTLTLNVDGFLRVCGINEQGRLGDGTFTQRNDLAPVACPTTLGGEDFTTTYNLKVYPNPVNNMLNISFEEIMKSVEIYNLLGQEVISKSINANETSIDVSQLPSGTYFVKVQIANTSKTIKVIKR